MRLSQFIQPFSTVAEANRKSSCWVVPIFRAWFDERFQLSEAISVHSNPLPPWRQQTGCGFIGWYPVYISHVVSKPLRLSQFIQPFPHLRWYQTGSDVPLVSYVVSRRIPTLTLLPSLWIPNLYRPVQLIYQLYCGRSLPLQFCRQARRFNRSINCTELALYCCSATVTV